MILHPESEQALKVLQDIAGPNPNIVFVSGNFNVVHPGHLRLLRFAADCGAFLVVGVNDKSSPGTSLPEDLRLEGVKSIKLVNFAFVLHDTPAAFIERLKPAIVVKGKEHEEAFNQEQAAVETYGGKLLFSSGEVRFSSLELLRKELFDTNPSTVVKPMDYPARHGFSMTDLRSTLAKFTDLRVTVIGDLIVDEYLTCDPLGMSQEDPTIVVTPVNTDSFVGGAGIVAAHARGLGAKVQFFSVVGKDRTAEYARERLESYGVVTHLFEDESRPTTLKQRYRARGKTLLRVSHLRQHDISQNISKNLLQTMKKVLTETDLLIFSDFNYGCLPQKLVEKLAGFCDERNIPMVADSQSSSQVGDVSRYRGMQLITPTEREARLAVRDFNSGLVVLAEALRRKSRARNIVVTLGAEGLLIHAATPNSDHVPTDQLPAFNTAPKDSAGAGDSFLTASSMALATGADIWQSAYLGSLAAACQVGRVGNIPLKPKDLHDEINI